MKTLFAIILTIACTQMSWAQEKCGTMKRYYDRVAKDPSLAEKHKQIETFTANWIRNSANKSSRVVITIPVVVHVIHAGEAVGTDANISDAQIYSQIDVLNLDFRRLNEDSLETNHPFWVNAADCEIEFCLAQQDEDGFPTDGIERIDGLSEFGSDVWSGPVFDSIVKPDTQWDPDSYLNIWTVDFDPNSDDSTTLGYATFPDEHGAANDGVVIGYLYFGTTGDVESPNDLGRTSTHEVGHYFNLFHIWGDDNCGDDQVADTPPQEAEHGGCPTFPDNPNNSCGSDANGEMYMNYMDYSDDDCLVMFTFGQSDRMYAAISGPRASLLNSVGCQAPTGINENIKSLSVSLYPNPVSDVLAVKYNFNDVRFRVYNSLGVLISEGFQTNAASLKIDASKLSDGCYLLQLESEGSSIVKKFTVNK